MVESQTRSTWRLAITLGALVILCFIVWSVWPKPAPAPVWAEEYDVTAGQPETIAPGTVVGRTAPVGWSHLVIKSLPRIRPGEESKLPLLGRSSMIRMASWMFTAFVVDIRPDTRDGRTHHHIRAVALGLGTASGGRDVIITPGTAADHGVGLDWITREILSRGYETQAKSKVVIHGATMAVVDTPVWYRSDGRHELLRFRYALLVDAAKGKLESLVWLLDKEGKTGDGTVVLLVPNTIDEAELIPEPTEFNTVGIPSDAAFAVDRLPPGRARALLPPDLRLLAAQGKYTSAEAGSLERGLRQLLTPHQAQ